MTLRNVGKVCTARIEVNLAKVHSNEDGQKYEVNQSVAVDIVAVILVSKRNDGRHDMSVPIIACRISEPNQP